jgi:phospholipid/cholesterol/gamma-HCH transport system substrate-binding protein
MKKESGAKWKLGLFTTIGLLLLVATIYFIGKQKNIFGQTFRVKSAFSNVSGLKVGNNVRFGGITIGTVDDIQLTTDTSVIVSMILQKSVQHFIKKDATASIGSDGLMGDKVIVIAPGTYTEKEIIDNDMLATHAPVETDQIMASLKVSADNAAIITQQLAQITYKINNGKGALSKILADSTFANNITHTMTNLKKSSEGLNENMEAAKHNFLLRGYFKKKEKEKKKKEEEAAKEKQDDKKDTKKEKNK